ncbi:MAG: MFS transporter [Actinomycetaceae bacterium]|nr:MFS transporter [Actinomycetaceae bacterium]
MQSSPFRALTHYRVLPQIAGWKYLLIAFTARAPYAMIPLGTMTAFTVATDSVSTGAYATAAVALSTALAAPLIGKWADARGPALPLKILTPLNAMALGLLFLAAMQATQGILLILTCILAGATSLPIGSFTRSRWITQTKLPRELNAALSYESMADELVFVLGPALVGIAASAAAPAAPLGLAFAMVATVGIIFARQTAKYQASLEKAKTTDDRASKTSDNAAAAQPRPRPTVGKVLVAVIPTIIVMIGIGMYFGATQAATTMRADLAEAPTMAGLIYATMGLGSAVMAIMTVAIPERITLPMRIFIGGSGMMLAMLVVSYLPTLTTTAAFLTICGLFVGPTMVTAFSLTEILAPEGGIGVAMTSMQSSVTIGVSLGAAVGGPVAETYGDRPAFWLPVAAGVLIAAVGLGLNYRRRFSK